MVYKEFIILQTRNQLYMYVLIRLFSSSQNVCHLKIDLPVKCSIMFYI